jgi:HEAT repeat protein
MGPRDCSLVIAAALALLAAGCQLVRDRAADRDGSDKTSTPALPERTPKSETAATSPAPPPPAPSSAPVKPQTPYQNRSGTDAIMVLQLGGPELREMVPRVIEALQKEPNPETRCSAAWALVKADPRTTPSVPALVQAMQSDTEPRVRIAAAEALANIGAPAKESGPGLHQALQDKDPLLRVTAGLALARIDRESKHILPVLIGSLREKEAKVRATAATALGLLGPLAAEAVPALIVALKDPVPGVRLWSAGALGRIGPAAKSAVGALMEGLNDKEFRVAMAMSCALNEIDPEAPTKSLLANGGEQEIDQLARENQALVQRHLAVLKSVTDQTSARAARLKLDALAAEYGQGEKRMSSMPVVKFAVYQQKYQAAMRVLSEELEKETTRIKSLPEAYDMLKGQPLIDPPGSRAAFPPG